MSHFYTVDQGMDFAEKYFCCRCHGELEVNYNHYSGEPKQHTVDACIQSLGERLKALELKR